MSDLPIEEELDRRDASIALFSVPAVFLVILIAAPLALAVAAGVAGLDVSDEAQQKELLTTVPGLVAMVLGYQLVLAGAAYALARLSHRPPVERLSLGPGRLRPATAFCLAAGSLFVSWPLELLLVKGGVEPGPNLEGIVATIQARPVLTAIGFSVFPGVCEELFFRGLVQGGLARVSRPAIAIGVPAVVFGAMHLDPLQSPVAAVLGAWFGWLMWRTGSLRLAIFAHFLNNLVVAVAAGATTSDGASYEAFVTQPTFTVIGVTSGALLALGFVLLRRENSDAA